MSDTPLFRDWGQFIDRCAGEKKSKPNKAAVFSEMKAHFGTFTTARPPAVNTSPYRIGPAKKP
jgi:hypothetical protein